MTINIYLLNNDKNVLTFNLNSSIIQLNRIDVFDPGYYSKEEGISL